MKILSLTSKKFIFILFLFAFCGQTIGQTTSGAAYIWSTTTSWTPTGVPLISGTVTVNNPLTLDQNLTIGTGNYTFNQDVTDQPGGSNYNLTNLNASGSLTIASGTTTIGGITDIGGNATFTLTVKIGATLILGIPGSTSNNFLIGNKASIIIEQGATLIVYGNIVNSNSTGSFIVNGLLQVYGDYITDNGNIDVSGTTGQFYTTGAMTTQGNSSQIYGSSNNCTSNCSGTSLDCGTGGISYSATILPQSQTVCSGGLIAPMTFTTNAPSPTYEWQYSLTAGGAFTSISGQTSSNYTPSALSVTTWYRVKYTSSTGGCGTKYSAPVPVYVSASTYTQSTAGQTLLCGGVFGPISVSAFGMGLTYQWYSNNSANNYGGTLISGVTSNVYTPLSTTSGTKYYYCIINSSCNIPFLTAVSGAFTVNLNSVVTASSSPELCVNTLMTNITRATTGATGIGTATGLPSGVIASWGSNTITISGIPTVSGTFNYSIPLTGGCGAVNATGIVIVNPTTVGGTVTGGTTICSGSTSTFLTLSGQTGTIIKWQSSVSPFSTWTDIANMAATYTSGILSETTKFRAVVQSGSCAAVNSVETTITVSASPNAPTLGTTTQPNCKTPTGTITVTTPSPAAGVTYTVTGTIPVVAAVTNTTGVFTGMVAGDYNVITTNGCASLPTPVVINSFVLVTNTWDGSAWSTGLPPTAEQEIVFNGVFSSEGDIEACSCIVNNLLGNLGDVIINSGHTLTLTNGLTVARTTLPSGEIIAGSMAFLDGASLVQTNNVANSGDIDYQRITDARKTDYTYWSSPVTPMSLGDLYYPYTSNGTFYSYEATTAGEDWSPFDAVTEMVAGKGYIANQGAEVPSGIPPPPGLLDVTFVGVPNNGHYEIDAIADRSYLLGNPYPSALDADTFLNANADVLNGTLYFWTHNTQIGIGVSDPGTGLYAYSGNDYATYNATGGVAATQPDLPFVPTGPAPSGGSGGNNSTPSGKIASGQGFFASSKVGIPSSKIIYDNTMRVGVIDILEEDNSQFFKTRNPTAKTTKKIQKNRIWLNLTNTQGAFKQTLIGYVADATNDYDNRFDGESFDGNEFVDFYSVNQEMNLVIQGRALPFDNTDEVPLGYRTTINGDFTINIDQTDGLLINQSVYLEDKLTKTVFDLKTGNYTFNTVAGTFNDRFVLRYTDNSSSKTLETANFDSLDKTVLVSNKNKQIKIDSSVESIDKVAIFDLLGRQIYQKDKVDSNELSIALTSIRQTLVVKVMLQNGNTISKKIIY